VIQPIWIVLTGHEDGCPCFGCCVLNDLMWSEAAASVALDNDPHMQTMSLDELNGLSSNPEAE